MMTGFGWNDFGCWSRMEGLARGAEGNNRPTCGGGFGGCGAEVREVLEDVMTTPVNQAPPRRGSCGGDGHQERNGSEEGRAEEADPIEIGEVSRMKPEHNGPNGRLPCGIGCAVEPNSRVLADEEAVQAPHSNPTSVLWMRVGGCEVRGAKGDAAGLDDDTQQVLREFRNRGAAGLNDVTGNHVPNPEKPGRQ